MRTRGRAPTPPGGKVSITLINEAAIVQFPPDHLGTTHRTINKSDVKQVHGWTREALRRFRQRILLTQFPVTALMLAGLPLHKTGRQGSLEALYGANRGLLDRRGPIRRLVGSGELMITSLERFHYLGCFEQHVEVGRPLAHWHTMLNISGVTDEIVCHLRDWLINQLGGEATFNLIPIPNSDQEHIRRYLADGDTKNNPRNCTPRRVTMASKGIPEVIGETIEMTVDDYLSLCKQHRRKPYSAIQYDFPKLLG